MNESPSYLSPGAATLDRGEKADGGGQRPRLAPGIRFHGEMSGVGFTSRQWLIERDQHYLQVSELLYRVAEQIDGRRTLTEIAAAVTDGSEWALEADHVQHLIEKKLRPLGVVTGATGEIAARPPASASISPLRLNMRMRMFAPSFVERLTRVLQYAYAPPLLIPIAVLIAFAHWWLYSVSGVARGVESALYQPGALGAVLVLTIVAGLFHELGHSSALRYGGGQPRGIGFGFYLMFPAFYSDVTDNYRLRRLARIRTDLGGIYFHLIFAAGLIGLSAWTGNQFLIAAALLFNVEALRQFIPFVRLDGYWLLADLTGVPDFMTQIGSFARSVRPSRRHRIALPQFKPWVAGVFGLYLLLSIPAMVYVVGWMVMYLPELTALTHKALLVQSELWSATQEPVTRMLIGLQIALVPLPLAATAYFLYLALSSAASQVAARADFNATAFPLRRLAGAAVVAAAVAFVAVGWAPALSGPAGAASPAAPDSRLDPIRLVERVQIATARVLSLQADLTGTLGDEILSGSISLSRPNRAHIEVRGAVDSLGTYTVISDGTTLFVFFPASRNYTEVKAAADGGNINAFIVDQVRTFFRPERLTAGTGQQLTYVGRERVDGNDYQVVEVRGTVEDAPAWRYYISPTDDLVHRVVTTTSFKGKISTRVVRLENIRINDQLDNARFQWAPPADAAPLGLEALGVALPVERPKH